MGGRGSVSWPVTTDLVRAAAGLAFQAIERAAIGAQCIATCFDGQVDARVGTPVALLRHRAMQWQVAFGDFDDALGIVVPQAHVAPASDRAEAVGVGCSTAKYASEIHRLQPGGDG